MNTGKINTAHILYNDVYNIFVMHGIKDVSMDEISKKLKISKKTLYKFVTSRPDLVLKVMEWKIAQVTKQMNEIISEDFGAIKELYTMTKCIMTDLTNLNSKVLSELRFYYPSAWVVFLNYLHSFVIEKMQKNIKKGILEGMFKAELVVDIHVKLYVHQILFIFSPEAFLKRKYNLWDAYKELVSFHLHTIMTTEGIEELKKFDFFVLNELENELLMIE